MDLVWSGSQISKCKLFHNIPQPVDEILQKILHKSDLEKIDYVSNLLRTKNLFKGVQSITKSAELSTQLRTKGNGYYKEKKFAEAFRAYNLAICFSPPLSPEFYFALANRSAIHFEQRQFNLCKSDIDLVLQSEISSSEITQLKSKLKSRIQRCNELEEEEAQEKKNSDIVQNQYKKLDYFNLANRNGAIPSAQDFIDIRTSTSRGRHVVTKKFIPAGTVVIVEQPFAKILLNQFRWDINHCHTCLGSISNGISCDSCVFAIFCSSTCQDAQDVYMCQISSYLHSLNPSRTLLLATKIITNLGPTKLYQLFLNQSTTTPTEEPLGFVDGVYASDNYHTILNLIYHKVTPLELFQYIVEAYAVTEALWLYSNFFESHPNHRDVNFKLFVCQLIVLHLQNLPPNAHSINKLNSLDIVEYGAGAYSLLSLINHSCDPNVTRFNLKNGLVAVITIKSVQADTELLDNYGVHYAVNEFEERQKHLSEHYYFTCDCEACIYKWPLFHTLKQKQVNNFSTKLQSSHLSNSQVEIVHKKFDCLFTKVMNGESVDISELIECLRFYETNFNLPFVKFNEAQETFKFAINTILS